MQRRVVHFELPVGDPQRAGEFYRKAFGWSLMPMPEMDYTIVMSGPTSEESGPTEPGFINGGLNLRENAPGGAPCIVVDVDDLDDALSEVQAAGGEVVVERVPVGDMGGTAYVRDPEGNIIGLWQTLSG